MAEQVQELAGDVSNGGWLRFDGSRLAEERGSCYVQLRRPGLAEITLSDALRQNLSARRRGSVLTDLAMIGVQRGDVNQLVTYADAALKYVAGWDDLPRWQQETDADIFERIEQDA